MTVNLGYHFVNIVYEDSDLIADSETRESYVFRIQYIYIHLLWIGRGKYLNASTTPLFFVQNCISTKILKSIVNS